MGGPRPLFELQMGSSKHGLCLRHCAGLAEAPGGGGGEGGKAARAPPPRPTSPGWCPPFPPDPPRDMQLSSSWLY